MKIETITVHDILQVIMSKLPEKYQKITMAEAIESTDEQLKDLKEFCIAFNNYQFANALKFLKDEN